MNLDTQTTPRPQNYGKFSAHFYFTPGQNLNPTTPPTNVGWIDLGNCTSSQQKSGMKSADVSRSRRGFNTLVDAPVTALAPALDLTSNEVRCRKAIPTRIFGTQGPDITQAAATASSVTFAAVYQNLSYDLNKRSLLNVSVKIGTNAGATAVQDVDYQIDPVFGTITIMEGAIPDSTTNTPSAIVVTFDNNALTRSTFQEYTSPNAYGLLRWFEEDSFGPIASSEKIAYVNLVAGDPGANDATKYRDDKLTAKILSTVYRADRKD